MRPDPGERYLVFRLIDDGDRSVWRMVHDTHANTAELAVSEAIGTEELPAGRFAAVEFEDWGEYRAQVTRSVNVERHP